MFHNSGHFARSLPRLLAKGESSFVCFIQFSDWLFARFGRTHAIALNELATALFIYLRSIGDDPAEAGRDVDGLVFHKVDRACRNLADLALLERLEADEGKRVFFSSQEFPQNAAGRRLPVRRALRPGRARPPALGGPGP
jgi:hypothetical protein